MKRVATILLLLATASVVRADGHDHWAFKKPTRPTVPQVVRKDWGRNAIDAFVLQRLQQVGLSPSKEAEPLVLLRRVTFDLIGLPPSPEEIDAFLKDYAATPQAAYEKVVDRLLSSPHYGERWAQHWLDVVRYAETNGYEADGERAHAWRYRDYVVKSFNENKPFDRFLTEQIAGDELAAGKDTRANADLWVATGMHRCGPMHLVGGNVDPEVTRNEVLTEMVVGVSSAFLGLTMGCARCHDHKFDPVSQKDYYSLEAFFASTRLKDVDFSSPEERNAHQVKLLATMAKIAPVKAQVAAIDAPYQARIREAKKAKLEPKWREALDTDAKKRTPEQERLAKEAQTLIKVTWDETLAIMSPEDKVKRAELRAKQHAIEAELPMPPSQAWAVADDGKEVTTYVLKRGEVKNKGPAVEASFPTTLAGKAPERKLTRKDLADWLTSPEHPLMARVFVNRLWQHHFGRGIVGTPNDFGLRGEKPTHPELLDWLAVEFREGGWDIKRMHRMLVLSATYRQTSEFRISDFGLGISNPKSEIRNPQSDDPENKLLWRMNRRRLEGESLRDAMLAAAGTLNPEIGGPMVRVPLEPEVYDLIFTEGEPDGLWPVNPDRKQHTRRSLYLFHKRNVRQPILEAFDQPDSLTSCAERPVSTFAPQALILMNGPLAREQSRAMAQLLLKSGNQPEGQIDLAYRRCFGRLPTAAEKKIGTEFLKSQQEVISRAPMATPDATGAALADYCLALFNSNEFIYIR